MEQCGLESERRVREKLVELCRFPTRWPKPVVVLEKEARAQHIDT